MRKRNNLPLGKLGENIASHYLQKQGYKIIKANFQKGYSQIDLVALDKSCLVFVEVKTRRSMTYGSGEESVGYFKIRQIIKSSQYYLLTHPQFDQEIRIDVISILLSEDRQVRDIKHFKNITL